MEEVEDISADLCKTSPRSKARILCGRPGEDKWILGHGRDALSSSRWVFLFFFLSLACRLLGLFIILKRCARIVTSGVALGFAKINKSISLKIRRWIEVGRKLYCCETSSWTSWPRFWFYFVFFWKERWIRSWFAVLRYNIREHHLQKNSGALIERSIESCSLACSGIDSLLVVVVKI